MKKVVVFSQIDEEILSRLQQHYHVVVLNPKLGDINEQIRQEVVDADGMIGAGRLLNESNLSPAQKLKIISSVTVGYDNYDVDLNAESKALMGKAQFELMQKHAIFINIARGSVVDEQALIEALQNEVIFAAGLDVYEKEPLQESALFNLPNVVTLPHVGSATAETRKKMANLAYKNLVEALEDKTPRYLVNPNFV
ncbi:NAD(P)-dependent oxidoreductase [Acinetobacter baumannii]